MSSTRKLKRVASTGVEKQAKFITENAELDMKAHAAKILETVQKSRKSNQEDLRRRLVKFRQDLAYTRTHGKDPLQLFPQEIWEMILNSVEDVTQLANCAKTCTLFQSIINSSAQELLFAKIIPFVLPYFYNKFGYFDMKILVTCGRVCKKWRSGVDTFADEYFCTQKFIPDNLDKLKLEPIKCFEHPNKHMLYEAEYYQSLPISAEEKQEMIESGERSESESDLGFSDIDSDDEHEIRDQLREQRKQKKIGSFPFLTSETVPLSLQPSKLASLKRYGPLLWNVTLKVEQPIETFHTALQEFCTLLPKVFESCPNLRMLTLWHLEKSSVLGAGYQGKEILERLELPPHPKLESLRVCVEHAGILSLQIGILRKLSSKLEHLRVDYWNDNMSALHWDKLTSLVIMRGPSTQVLSALERLKAPNLYKLQFRLDSSTLDLGQVFKSINQFPSLGYLVLVLTNEFSKWTHKDILGVPLALLTANRITTLKVICTDVNVSRDVSLLFPMVRNLALRYGNGLEETTRESSIEDSESDAEDADSDKNEETELIASSQVKPYIELYRRNLMYKSNIWKLFPQLQELKLVGGRYDRNGKEGQGDRYTRQGYYLETDIYLHGQQLHLRNVWENADTLIRERLKEEQDALDEIAASIKHKIRLRGGGKAAEKSKQSDEEINKKIFFLVVPMLSKREVCNCRRVSKTWWRAIDDEEKPVYEFGFPLTTKKEKQKFESNLQKSQASPFFARNINIRINKATFELKDVSLLLKGIGKYITRITITADEQVIPDILDIHQICVEITKRCPELRKWSFNVPNISSNYGLKKELQQKFKKLLKLKNLETLFICGPEGEWNSVIDELLEEIGNMCHLQLKALQQIKPHFNILQCYKEFTKLEELTVTSFNANEMSGVYHLYSIAPNLKHLCLCINEGTLTIRALASVTEDSKNLKHIELQFGSTFHGLNTNLIYSHPKNLLEVSTAKIVFINKYQVSLDFLVHMPYLRTLCITYGQFTPMLNNNTEITEDKRFGLFDEPTRQPEKDFIQLVKYFKDENLQKHDLQGIQGSNIWMVLRKLQTLEIVYCPRENIRDKVVFNRP